jgi:hypothetical protein
VSDPTVEVSCGEHGKSHATFVCQHLTRSSGLGFFTADDPNDPRPDAWCGRCDELLAKEGSWTERAEAFAHVRLACANCYDRFRMVHRERIPILFPDGFRCASCDELHRTLPLDFGFGAPVLSAEDRAWARLTEDTCVSGDDYYVRGCLEIPLVDASGSFVWGVWTSLKKENFERFLALMEDPNRADEPPYFGWLMSAIPGYPDTVTLKTHVHTRPGKLRPFVELEPTEHPLALEQWNGITVARARELALAMMHPR